jgi:hypothetical protein
MANELKAEDLIPLIAKLSKEERRRLTRLALSQGFSDPQAYTAQPTSDDEFTGDDDLLSWEAEGWENIG